MVYIRTDANETIATGHVMRCLTIAHEIVQLGEKVCFIISDKESAGMISGQGFPFLITFTKWDNTDIEYEYKMLQGYAKNGDILLVDSYFLNSDYLMKMKSLFRIAVFDDMFAEKFPADIVINYNLYFEKYNYAERYAGTNTKLLLGSKYVPLRKEFLNVKPAVNEEINTILLICGGGDKYHILPELVRRICFTEKGRKYKFLVIAGGLNKDVEELKTYEKNLKNVKVYQNVKSMVSVMQQADMVISAASTVLYECCRMQLPTIFFTMADNQEDDVEAFADSGIMKYAGDIRKNRTGTIAAIMEMLEEVTSDETVRRNLIERMRKVVDGKGAWRIAKAIINHGENE